MLIELTGEQLKLRDCKQLRLAACSFLVLAQDGETIVSRGELVEIGWRLSRAGVMSNSGTRMIEVGTTNRHPVEDFTRSINPNTRLLMRVHPSNYRMSDPTHRTCHSCVPRHERGLFLMKMPDPARS